MLIIPRPQTGEYGEFYAGYIGKVTAEDALVALESGLEECLDLLNPLPTARWDHRYAPGKWTVKEIIHHLIDSERVFAYRALRVARGDETPLPGFDQDLFVVNGHAGGRSPASLLDEYRSVRAATLTLFRSLQAEDLQRRGTASGFPVTPRAVAFIIAGHERHHLEIIRQRYLDDQAGA